MGLFGIVLSLGLLMFLAYRGINVLILAPLLSALAVIMSGGLPVLATYTQVFMDSLGGYIITYFPLFLLGAIFGPVLGVWLSLVSIDRIDAGVAATLMSLSPVFILPVARIVEHEHIGLRAVLGAVLAVIGVGVLVASGDGSDGASPPDDEVMSIESSSASVTSRVSPKGLRIRST